VHAHWLASSSPREFVFSNLFSVDRKPLFVVWPAGFFSFVVVIVRILRG